MAKTKKAQVSDEVIKWVIGAIIFLIVLGALYFLFKTLGIKIF